MLYCCAEGRCFHPRGLIKDLLVLASCVGLGSIIKEVAEQEGDRLGQDENSHTNGRGRVRDCRISSTMCFFRQRCNSGLFSHPRVVKAVEDVELFVRLLAAKIETLPTEVSNVLHYPGLPMII